MVAAVNFDATIIPDEAQVWIAHKADVTNITAMYPAGVGDDLEALGWNLVGLVDGDDGISLEPDIEVKEYDAFGYPRYRVKLKKGKLDTTFVMLEDNEVTKGIALPGSAGNKIGIPRDTQIYVLYKFVDEDRTYIWVSERPAPAQITASTGIKEGEPWSRTVRLLHSGNALGDAFHVVTDAGATAWTATLGAQSSGTFTLTWGGNTTAGIAYNAAASAVKSALVALDDGYTTADWTVTGSAGGPYTVTPPVASSPVTGNGASLGTPGTFVIAPVVP